MNVTGTEHGVQYSPAAGPMEVAKTRHRARQVANRRTPATGRTGSPADDIARSLSRHWLRIVSSTPGLPPHIAPHIFAHRINFVETPPASSEPGAGIVGAPPPPARRGFTPNSRHRDDSRSFGRESTRLSISEKELCDIIALRDHGAGATVPGAEAKTATPGRSPAGSADSPLRRHRRPANRR